MNDLGKYIYSWCVCVCVYTLEENWQNYNLGQLFNLSEELLPF